ncbi:cinnamoyl-CoA reductase 1-like [Melia azedarach]|uniref:Cinnamoyl-CoA reductase 1-like n=2 Tax=Melia azedarach TaxID=155640 RepID=A0ACC1XIW6_MELAZ|nr:cinnamoyl-CoA reductase 1-like [Melia azedarach]KAJ4711382.1 cinnamoyl-CoA reductase 1-like [Melia azedarach]
MYCPSQNAPMSKKKDPKNRINTREGKVVCVTGASGCIGSWLVKQLLQRGYTVRAAVLDPSDPKITAHLHALDGAKERLHTFKANLLEEGSFDAPVDGCEGVFHLASTVIFSSNDPQAEIIDPAVKGTLNVLISCSKVLSIKRVVVTSSIASTYSNGTPLTEDVVLDETWFSNPDVCKELNMVPLSKTLAEAAAWNFAEENGINLVTIQPGFVIVPFLQPNLNFSVGLILNLINGDQKFPSPCTFVDVRDIAYAHIFKLFRFPQLMADI